MSDDRLVLHRRADVRRAATLLAAGMPVAHGFGSIYALTARGDAVRRVNALKGRPLGQTGSVTAPTGHELDAFDLSALPPGVSPRLVHEVVEAFGAVGPFGFRGPAAGHVPAGLAALDGHLRTAQVIVPGHACPSQAFLAAAAEAVGHEPLSISSANRSRHVTGGLDAPVHWRADALRAELPGVLVLEHDDDAAARARFPRHTTVSTTILGLHRAERSHGRLHLVLERHGSLRADDVARVLHGLGLGLTIGARAAGRLAPRAYEDALRDVG